MAPTKASKPKRKRQRKRRQNSDSDDFSSSSDEEVTKENKSVEPPSEVSSSSSSSDSSSDWQSSEDEAPKKKKNQTEAARPSHVLTKKSYPERSPSPEPIIDAVPIGLALFPQLKHLPTGPILEGFVPGDAAFKCKNSSTANVVENDPKIIEERTRFGAWWRGRLVEEFGSELGNLVQEPNLPQERINLLLASINSLSDLHTTSGSKSLWLHNPEVSIDPLASLSRELDGDWAKALVGGLDDVKVGLEGIDLTGSSKTQEERMEVD